MEIKSSRIVSATTKESGERMTLDKSAKVWGFGSMGYYCNNSLPLHRIYNEAIEIALTQDIDCLILVHDDVILEEDPIPKLEKLFDDYDLVGVAGASKIELKSPALWHLMGGGFGGGNLHGRVLHKCDPMICNGKVPTEFGPYPHRVVMIDGVFMALNRKAMETMRFDETNPCGFHFYDLQFSLDAHISGLRVGVGDILITHESPGLREISDDWRTGEKYFLNKYEQ